MPRFPLFTILMFFGLSSISIGWRVHETAVIIFGVVFLALTGFSFRRSIPRKVLIGSYTGSILGISFGIWLGSIFSASVKGLIGIVGAGMVGAIAGIMTIQ